MKSLILFSNDLRLDDNEAICASVEKYHSSTFAFVYDEELYKNTHGSANLWWLENSLKSLKNRLKEKNICLHIMKGEYVSKILEIVKDNNFKAVFLNQNKHPNFIVKEKKLDKELSRIDVKFYSFNNTNLSEPDSILNKSGEPYKVYSPFYKHCKSIYVQKKVFKFPKDQINTHNIKSDVKHTEEIFSKYNNTWFRKFETYWKPGEPEAKKMLKDFFNNHLSTYKEDRDYLDISGTSKLSPYLRFGEITSNQIISEFKFHSEHKLTKHEEHFIKELYWREFSYYILYHFPYVTKKPFNKKYENFKWNKNYDINLNKWKKGKTGIRIVDAAMNELWETGYMHNRTRMITASFLTKNLLIPWQEGEKWFRDTLLDADIANNTMGWQWVSGCGTDAAPYFRIFNPVLQEKKFDPNNQYSKKWLKNFSDYPDDDYKEDLFNNNNFIKPIVDLSISRNEALERFSKIK